jgi:sugar lactone lactonase YvrE
MTKKILTCFITLIIFSCSSTKKTIKENSTTNNSIEKNSIEKNSVAINKTQIINYTGIDVLNHSYLRSPSIAIPFNGNILISDTGNDLIRQIKNNIISTYAGNGIKQNIDGERLNSSFNTPEDIVTDSKNNIYVVVGYDQIRKIDTNGNVTAYAGKYTPGFVEGGIDGPKDLAIFKFISALKLDSNDNIYVADKHKIRKITKEGIVTTISGQNKSGDNTGKANKALYNQIADLTINDKGDIFVVDQVNKKIKKISNKGLVSTFVDKGIFKWPSSIEIDNKGNIIVFDSSSKILFRFNNDGELINKIIDRKLTTEDYYFHVKISVDERGNILIPSENFINIIDENFQITQVGKKNGNKINGNIKDATFYIPYDGVFDKNGNLFVLDKGNYLVRKISKQGIVSNYSGNGNYGSRDGNFRTCSFKTLNAITIDQKNNLYILDGSRKNVTIRKVDTLGNTTTFIDTKQNKINWERPSDLIMDSKSNIYVSDAENNKIYKIEKSKTITEFITMADVKLNKPHGLTIDKQDNLFVCDSYNNRIVKISKEKKIEFITSSNGINFDEPENITIDDSGNLYVTDKNRTRIIKIKHNKELELFLEESSLGKNKSRKLSEYYNTLKIESHENKLFVFDKYDHKIIILK